MNPPPANTAASTATGPHIDLGLALLSMLRKPGERLSLTDIAAWRDCSHQSIARIEARALRKLRERLAEHRTALAD